MSEDGHERVPAARRPVVGGAVLVLLVLAAYWPVLRGGFVWDDAVLIDRNSLVTGDSNLLSIWCREDFPLSIVVLWLQWLAWGKNPLGFHVVNLLLHATSALLVGRVLARWRVPGAWLAAALFAVHPVGVASVAWISELKNTLSLPFFLTSLLCFLKFEENEAERQVRSPKSEVRNRRFYWLSLGAFLLALLSKTSTVTLPLVLLACVWWRGARPSVAPPDATKLCCTGNKVPSTTPAGITEGRRAGLLSTGLRVAPFFALALTFGLMTLWFHAHHVLTGPALPAEGFGARLAGAGWVLWFYLGKALLPLNLAMIYPRWEINAVSLWTWLPLAGWMALLGVAWWFRWGWGRPVLFALGCFTALLFPVLGFFDIYFFSMSRVSDHFAYLALLPVVALVGAMLGSDAAWAKRKTRVPTLETGTGDLESGARGSEHPTSNIQHRTPNTQHATPNTPARKAVATVLAAAVVMAFAALTMQRARVFATDEGLWRDTLAKNPAAWTAHNNLGCILAEQQNLDEARKHFEASLKFNPRNAEAHRNLGKALAQQGRFAEAEPHFQTALDLKPGDVEALKAYAGVLAEQGRLDDAVRHLRDALRSRPDAEARLQLAGLLRATGDIREAIAQFRAALATQPETPAALNNLAWLLATTSDATLRDGAEAVRLAEAACRLTEDKDAMMVGTLATAYAEAGRFEDAMATAQRAIELANAAGNTQFAAINQQLLRLYRAGRPYHEPPPKRGALPR